LFLECHCRYISRKLRYPRCRRHARPGRGRTLQYCMQASLAAGRLLRCCPPFTHVLLPCYRSVRAAYRARQPAYSPRRVLAASRRRLNLDCVPAALLVVEPLHACTSRVSRTLDLHHRALNTTWTAPAPVSRARHRRTLAVCARMPRVPPAPVSRARHRRTLTVCARMPRVPPAPVLSSSVRSQLAIVPWSAACAPSRGPPQLASCSLSLYARAPSCHRSLVCSPLPHGPQPRVPSQPRAIAHPCRSPLLPACFPSGLVLPLRTCLMCPESMLPCPHQRLRHLCRRVSFTT
jgi:hypothetical protein